MTCDGLASHPGGVEILLAASCYRNLGYAPAAMIQQDPRLHFVFVFFFLRLVLPEAQGVLVAFNLFSLESLVSLFLN